MKIPLALSAIFLNASIATAVEVHLPAPQIETLPNGLEVAWFINSSLPMVDLSLLIKSGYREDPVGKSGVSELLSVSLDRGAAGMSAQEIAHSVEMLGATRYSLVDEDSFSIGMHGLAPDATALLELLGKIGVRPDFPMAEVSREQARFLDRWNHLGDSGESLASLAYQRVIASGTVYGRGSFSSIQEFRHLKREDVLAFYRTHFTPKNALLIVIGRVDKKVFGEKIRAIFGPWHGEAPARIQRKFSDPRLSLRAGEIVMVDRPGLTQAQVRVGFHAPSVHASEHYALTVANALFGEYFNSRLNSEIRDKLGLSYSVASSFSYSKEFAFFSIGSATRNETVGKLLEKTIQLLHELKQGPIPADEVRMAKDYLMGGFPLSVSTLSAVASRWAMGDLLGMGPDYLNEFVPRISAVTAPDVSSAVKKDFDLSHLLIVIAGDSKEVMKSLSLSSFKQVKKVSVKDLL